MVNTKTNYDIKFTKGNTFALKVTFKNIAEDLRIAHFTIKENPDDETPIIQKSLGSGITKIDDRTYRNEKTYKIQLQAYDSVDLEPNYQYFYDFQVTVGGVVKTIISGFLIVSNTITGTADISMQDVDIEETDTLETDLETTPPTNGIEYEQDPVAIAKIGDMENLSTTAKDTIVNSINEVRSEDIGDKSTLNTTEKRNLVGAINEVNSNNNTTNTNIGDLSELDTTDKTSVVNAINEVNGNVGSLEELDTTDKTSVVNAINENKGQIDGLKNGTIPVVDCESVNGLEITRDANGVLKIGNIVIPQEEVLWTGDVETNFQTSSYPTVTLSKSLNAGDKIKITGFIKRILNPLSNPIIKYAPVEFVGVVSPAYDIMSSATEYIEYYYFTSNTCFTTTISDVAICYLEADIPVNATSTLRFTGYTEDTSTVDGKITKIVKIIE